MGLGEPSDQSEVAQESKKAPKESIVQPNKKFQLLNLKTRFTIQNVPADPEVLLLGIFQYCIDEVIEECKQHGMEADQVGVTISS